MYLSNGAIDDLYRKSYSRARLKPQPRFYMRRFGRMATYAEDIKCSANTKACFHWLDSNWRCSTLASFWPTSHVFLSLSRRTSQRRGFAWREVVFLKYLHLEWAIFRKKKVWTEAGGPGSWLQLSLQRDHTSGMIDTCQRSCCIDGRVWGNITPSFFAIYYQHSLQFIVHFWILSSDWSPVAMDAAYTARGRLFLVLLVHLENDFWINMFCCFWPVSKRDDVWVRNVKYSDSDLICKVVQ